MKKIITFIICTFLLLVIGNTNAEFKTFTKDELQEQSKKVEEIKNRKLYHTFESNYVPNSNDNNLLEKVNLKLKKINNISPANLRKIYNIIYKKLQVLGKQYRDSNGNPTTKKDTRIYYILEKINNNITDFDGNQDLGCLRNIGKAHMENGLCESNFRHIEDETGIGSQSYDYIFNHKWGNIMMTHCNSGYTKKESFFNGSPIVLCLK